MITLFFSQELARRINDLTKNGYIFNPDDLNKEQVHTFAQFTASEHPLATQARRSAN